MLHALAPDLLAHILLLAVGPNVEPFVGHGGSALGLLPIVLGCDTRGLSGLRLVCKAFRDALSAVPVHLTVCTAYHVRCLARMSRKWNLVALKVLLNDYSAARQVVDAASALPERERRKIVTAVIQELSQAQVSHMLRKLEGLQHIVIWGLDTPGSATIYLDLLSHLERLDLHWVSISDVELLVLLPLLMHAACIVHRPTNEACGM